MTALHTPSRQNFAQDSLHNISQFSGSVKKALGEQHRAHFIFTRKVLPER